MIQAHIFLKEKKCSAMDTIKVLSLLNKNMNTIIAYIIFLIFDFPFLKIKNAYGIRLLSLNLVHYWVMLCLIASFHYEHGSLHNDSLLWG